MAIVTTLQFVMTTVMTFQVTMTMALGIIGELVVIVVSICHGIYQMVMTIFPIIAITNVMVVVGMTNRKVMTAVNDV